MNDPFVKPDDWFRIKFKKWKNTKLCSGSLNFITRLHSNTSKTCTYVHIMQVFFFVCSSVEFLVCPWRLKRMSGVWTWNRQQQLCIYTTLFSSTTTPYIHNFILINNNNSVYTQLYILQQQEICIYTTLYSSSTTTLYIHNLIFFNNNNSVCTELYIHQRSIHCKFEW